MLMIICKLLKVKLKTVDKTGGRGLKEIGSAMCTLIITAGLFACIQQLGVFEDVGPFLVIEWEVIWTKSKDKAQFTSYFPIVILGLVNIPKQILVFINCCWIISIVSSLEKVQIYVWTKCLLISEKSYLICLFTHQQYQKLIFHVENDRSKEIQLRVMTKPLFYMLGFLR